MDFELMNSYRLSGVLCDVTIMVKGIEFPDHNHKIVLAVNAPYFRATFASEPWIFESHDEIKMIGERAHLQFYMYFG